MNFALSEEQEMLKRSAREFLKRECTSAQVRETMEGEGRGKFSPSFWRAIVRLGWTRLGLPEQAGGMGGGLVDTAVLFEEIGRAMAPSPLFATLALAGLPLARIQDPSSLRDELLPAIAEGGKIVTAALFEPGSGYEVSVPSTRAERSDGSIVLAGTKAYVHDADAADFILVSARTRDDVTSVFRVARGAAGVAVEPLNTLDWGRQYMVRLQSVEVSADAEVRGLSAEDIADCGAAVMCAEMVGGADAAMELAVQWARARVQFGRPIGSFQAVSHKCADMLVGVEAGRSLTYYACLAMDERRRDSRAAVSAAKSFLSDTCPVIAEAALQIHGGMGYTWEHDIHLYLRKARANEVRFGDAAFHQVRLLNELGW